MVSCVPCRLWVPAEDEEAPAKPAGKGKDKKKGGKKDAASLFAALEEDAGAGARHVCRTGQGSLCHGFP